jgi:hypothetical protein
MVDRATIQEFRERWQHRPNRADDLVRFRTRMLEVSETVWHSHCHSDNFRREFALLSGTPYSLHREFAFSGLYGSLKEAETEFEIVQMLQYLLWTVAAETLNGLDSCCRKVQKALDLSPGFMIQLVPYGDKVMLYPAGVRMLDEALVENNLAWLKRYPKASKPFEEALKIYMAKDPNQYRNMLDSLRCSVEQILRAVLNNDKSLENQKEEFLKWLAKYDAHSHIIGMYNDLLFNRFSKYQNDAVKHQEDNYTLAEVEFVLYVTGTFLRFIQRLAEQGVTAAKKTSA